VLEHWTLVDRNRYVTEASDLGAAAPRQGERMECLECKGSCTPWSVEYNDDNDVICWTNRCPTPNCSVSGYTVFND
jgi:hypothetical protein